MSCNQTRALNFTQRIIQGDSFDKAYTGLNRDTETGNETPIDFTNKTVRGSIRPSLDSDTVINFATSTFDSGVGTIDSFRLMLNASQTETMYPGTWVYDVDVVDNINTEKVTTLLKGNFIVRGEVTR